MIRMVIASLFLALPSFVFPAFVFGDELTLRFSQEPGSEPLTTERAFELDPALPNPHLQRWALGRKMEIKDVTPSKNKKGGFGIRGGVLEVSTRSYLRAPGPWFRELTEFPCTKEPASWFATEEGSRQALEEANRIFKELVRAYKLKLSLLLARVTASTEEDAVKKAEILYKNWITEFEEQWRVRAIEKIRDREWRKYWSNPAVRKICGKGPKSSAHVEGPQWEAIMEPLPSTLPPEEKGLLARAPARRWDGLFSVRLSITVGDKKLNGQFLIDSSAPMSVISEAFLESQGILPALVEIPAAPLRRIRWGLEGGEGLARRAEVDHVEMSGFDLPIKEFLLGDTDMFSPPETMASCCDGVLGNDFLRRFAVEFRSITLPKPFSEVLVREPKGFYRDPKTPWTEAELDSTGAITSACELNSETRKVRWDTASERAFEVSSVTQPKGKGLRRLSCSPSVVWKKIPAAVVQTQASIPQAAARVGMDILGRGSCIFDLPHGRVWIAKDTLSAPFLLNRSGLKLEYEMRDGDRVLRIKSIQPRSAAASLLKAGLKPGMLISQIDGKDAEEMDSWEVEQRLSGIYGKVATLGWEKRNQLKVAPLKVSSE